MAYPVPSHRRQSRAFRPVSARPPERRVPTLALAALVFATLYAGLGWAADAAGADPLQSAPSDQLRIVSVDTSAFPDVTATVALPISMRQDQDLSANLSVATTATPLRATVYRVSRDRPTVAILLDTDGRTSPSTFAAEQGAAAEWILELDPTSPVVIGTSSGVVGAPTLGTRAALDAVGRLQLGGTRNWTRTLNAALAVTGPSSRAVVVVVSTGPGDAKAAPSQLTSRTADADVSVSWIRLSANAGPSGALGDIASVESTPDALLGTLSPIASDLTTQYQLNFRANPTATAATVTLDAYGTRWTARTPLEPSAQPPRGSAGNGVTSSHSGGGFLVAFADDAATFINAHWIVWDALALAALLYLARDIRRA